MGFYKLGRVGVILGGKWVRNVGKIYNLRKRKCTGVGVFSSYIIYCVCVALFPVLCIGESKQARTQEHKQTLAFSI